MKRFFFAKSFKLMQAILYFKALLFELLKRANFGLHLLLNFRQKCHAPYYAEIFAWNSDDGGLLVSIADGNYGKKKFRTCCDKLQTKHDGTNKNVFVYDFDRTDACLDLDACRWRRQYTIHQN